MKDLIKEIEGLKRLDTKVSFDEGFNKGIDKCIELLNQYNIITAPKQIKLSEIVSGLNEIGGKYTKFIVYKRNLKDGVETIFVENENFGRQYFTIVDNQIEDLDEEMQINKFKWLYILWIASTEIINDMEELDNEI